MEPFSTDLLSALMNVLCAV